MLQPDQILWSDLMALWNRVRSIFSLALRFDLVSYLFKHRGFGASLHGALALLLRFPMRITACRLKRWHGISKPLAIACKEPNADGVFQDRTALSPGHLHQSLPLRFEILPGGF